MNVARIPERFAFIIRNKTERAAMARESKQFVQVVKETETIVETADGDIA